MTFTVADLKERLATSLDECDILDILKVDSFLLVEFLEDRIIEMYDDIIPEIEKLHEKDSIIEEEDNYEEDYQLEFDFEKEDYE